MENDILEKMRQESADMTKIARGDYSEIEELKMNPAVKRYLYLQELKDSRDLIEDGERIVVGKLIGKYGSGLINKTNNIWCCLCEVPASIAKSVFGIKLATANENERVIVYFDIENAAIKVAIKKEEQADFEASHKVVFGKQTIYDCTDRYFNTRQQFFSDCIEHGQEVSVQRLLEKPKW